MKKRYLLNNPGEPIIRFPESSCVIGLATGPVAVSFSLRWLKPATTNGFNGMRIRANRRAHGDRPQGMRHANSLRMAKGGACPPLLSRYKKSGFTLIEIMMVVLVGTLILLPTIMFLTSMQKNANKGYERLDSLTTARIVIQKAQRDLKVLCFDATRGFKTTLNSGGKDIFEFPIFPTEAYSFVFLGEKLNPVNIVRYIFDKSKRTVVRSISTHSKFAGVSPPLTSEIIGKNIESFSIEKHTLFSLPFYEIKVKCQSQHPLFKKEATFLRTAVRSKFEISLLENIAQIPNRFSIIDPPN